MLALGILLTEHGVPDSVSVISENENTAGNTFDIDQ